MFKMLDSINTEKYVIGKSTLGQNIFAFHTGNKEGKQILLTASIHAREYVSFFYCMHLLEILQKEKTEYGIWFVPLTNPDGVRICLDGIDWIENKKVKEQIVLANKSKDFSLFKANANCVDLNVNFDADWGKGKMNIRERSFANYIGEKPNSEIETKNLIKIAKKIKILFALNFHTKGKIIYYSNRLFGNKKNNDKIIANIISNLNNYQIIESKTSAGGYSDWIEMKMNKVALTIELGDDTWTHPIKINKLNSIINTNKKLELFLKNPSLYIDDTIVL